MLQRLIERVWRPIERNWRGGVALLRAIPGIRACTGAPNPKLVAREEAPQLVAARGAAQREVGRSHHHVDVAAALVRAGGRQGVARRIDLQR